MSRHSHRTMRILHARQHLTFTIATLRHPDLEKQARVGPPDARGPSELT